MRACWGSRSADLASQVWCWIVLPAPQPRLVLPGPEESSCTQSNDHRILAELRYNLCEGPWRVSDARVAAHAGAGRAYSKGLTKADLPAKVATAIEIVDGRITDSDVRLSIHVGWYDCRAADLADQAAKKAIADLGITSAGQRRAIHSVAITVFRHQWTDDISFEVSRREGSQRLHVVAVVGQSSILPSFGGWFIGARGGLAAYGKGAKRITGHKALRAGWH